MITFLDLVQQEQFRDYVCQRLIKHTNDHSYSFRVPFPPLYKYKALSEYAVNDIENNKFTLTSIGDFNDLFDGAMHRFGTEAEQVAAAEQKWAKLEKNLISAGLPDGFLTHDYMVNSFKNHYKVDSKLKFRELDYLGTYIGSLSTEDNSILMWSHYAQNNSGICIEYDFNQLPPDYLLRNMIFPVSYSCKTIELSDLLNDKKGEIYQYPLDAAVLCAALSKANIWAYEHEWRIVLVTASEKTKNHRLPICTKILPRSICFGYHFLKPMFCYDYNNSDEWNSAKNQIQLFLRLINYMEDKEIKAKIMCPLIGNYSLKAAPIDIELLKQYIDDYFGNGKPEPIHLYYSFHDKLMDVVEGK